MKIHKLTPPSVSVRYIFFFSGVNSFLLSDAWSGSRALFKWLTTRMLTRTRSSARERHPRLDTPQTLHLKFPCPSLWRRLASHTTKLSQLVHMHSNTDIHTATCASHVLHANILHKHLSVPAVTMPLQSVTHTHTCRLILDMNLASAWQTALSSVLQLQTVNSAPLILFCLTFFSVDHCARTTFIAINVKAACLRSHKWCSSKMYAMLSDCSYINVKNNKAFSFLKLCDTWKFRLCAFAAFCDRRSKHALNSLECWFF